MSAIAMILLAVSGFLANAATVVVDESCEGMGTVRFTERIVGDESELDLTVKAAKGYSFSGWLVDGNFPTWDVDARNPSLGGVRVPANSTLQAWFIDKADDHLEFDLEDSFGEIVPNEEFETELWIDSESYPTLKFTGLPAGLKFDADRMVVYGTPTKPGSYDIEVTGRNASGYGFWQGFSMTVSGLESERIMPSEQEVTLGEYSVFENEDLFETVEDYVSMEISGLPPGIEWRRDWALVFGTPTKAGVYAVKAVVRFADGKSESATALITVVDTTVEDAGIDASVLEGLRVGDCLEAVDCELGVKADGEGITKVSGLPNGLSPVSWEDESGVVHYGVEGMALKCGRFTVKATVAARDDAGSIKSKTVSWPVIVADIPDLYLPVAVMDEESAKFGSVSGGGVVSVGSTAVLTAKTGKGGAFAGWFDDAGEPVEFGDDADSRTSKVKVSIGPEMGQSGYYAKFVDANQDQEVMILDLGDEEIALDPDVGFVWGFSVESLSLPTMDFKGLPSGVVCEAVADGFVLSYDPAAVRKAPSPGRYQVVATATNQSKAKDAVEFTVVVPNLTDGRIEVVDDYGELMPGLEMEPISFADAVDFAAGETLTVSGIPKGLTYNKSANPKKGIEAYTLTGTPTTPGEYTLVFSAKVVSSVSTNGSGKVTVKYETATATAFLRILPHPEASVDLGEDAMAAGNKVSGIGSYPIGKSVTLKAVAAPGWVFAGWYGIDIGDGLDYLKPSLALTMGEDGLDVTADFIPIAEDWLYVSSLEEAIGTNTLMLKVGQAVDGGGCPLAIAELIGTVSLPTLSISGLPAGLKFDAKLLQLTGTPKKAGVCYATLSAKNAGGYTHSQVLRIAVAEADGRVPVESEPVNTAGIDLSPLRDLSTGQYCLGAGALTFSVPPSTAGAAVTKVTLKGLPGGLKDETVLQTDGSATVVLSGVLTKPGRFAFSAKVTYADRTSASAEENVLVSDGGSYYMSAESADPSLGTVTGGGVHAAGATVKLSAKAAKGAVFAGWYDESGAAFPWLAEFAHTDYRAASVSFALCPDELSALDLYGAFVTTTEDGTISVQPESNVWAIAPSKPSAVSLGIVSASLPKVSAKGLPSGVSYDAATGCLAYDPKFADKIGPGAYPISISVQNQSKASATASFEIFVENRTSEVISGLDPARDAYPCVAGVQFGANRIVPTVPEGWTLSAKGCPSGMSFDQESGLLTGTPSKAGTYTIAFTAVTGTGKAKRTEEATITVSVAELPVWAVGTFEGASFLQAEADGSEKVGQASVTVSSAGRISCKFIIDGKTWTWSGTGFSKTVPSGMDASDLDLLIRGVAKSAKQEMPFEMTVSPGSSLPNAAIAIGKGDDGRFSAVVRRNLWKDEVDLPELPCGRFNLADQGYPELEVTISAKGTAKFSGRIRSGIKFSSTATVFLGEDALYHAYLIMPSAKEELCLFDKIDL